MAASDEQLEYVDDVRWLRGPSGVDDISAGEVARNFRNYAQEIRQLGGRVLGVYPISVEGYLTIPSRGTIHNQVGKSILLLHAEVPVQPDDQNTDTPV